MPVIRAAFGWPPLSDKDTYNEALKNLKASITILNNALNGKDFLVAGRITVADIVLSVMLTHVFSTSLDAGYRKAMGNVTRWMEKMISLPEVVSTIGKVKFCAKTFPPHLAEKTAEVKAAPKV